MRIKMRTIFYSISLMIGFTICLVFQIIFFKEEYEKKNYNNKKKIKSKEKPNK